MAMATKSVPPEKPVTLALKEQLSAYFSVQSCVNATVGLPMVKVARVTSAVHSKPRSSSLSSNRRFWVSWLSTTSALEPKRQMGAVLFLAKSMETVAAQRDGASPAIRRNEMIVFIAMNKTCSQGE